MYSQDVTVLTQIQNFALAAAVGFFLGVFYDALRAIRQLSPRGRALNFICDILFMTFAAPVTFIFTVTVNEGVIRGYILLGEAVGFFIYLKTVGRISGAIMRFVRKVFSKIFSFILRPFKALLRLVFKPFGFFAKFCCKMLKKLKKFIKSLLKNRKELVYNDSVENLHE